MAKGAEHLGVLRDIVAERLRQEELKDRGKFSWTLADRVNPKSGRTILDAERLTVIAEEFGEVSREVCEGMRQLQRDAYRERLRTELIQLAACCVAWCEALDG